MVSARSQNKHKALRAGGPGISDVLLGPPRRDSALLDASDAGVEAPNMGKV